MKKENRRKLTIGLINVVLDGDYQYEQELPLGLAALGAFLRKNDYEVVFKQCFPSGGESAYESAADLEADVYGFQLNMVNYVHIRRVVDRLKSRKPEATVVFGGPFLVSLFDEIMKNEPKCDFIVLGEGEMTMLELSDAIYAGRDEFATIKGLVWRDKIGRIIRNENRDLISDLDALPFPARDCLQDARRDPRDNRLVESVRMVTSRGCVGKCSFCCVNLYNKVQRGKAWRGRSAKNVVDELEYLTKSFGARIFNFSDSSFEDPGEPGKNRARDICEEIIRRGIELSAKVYMRCETMKTEKDLDLLRLYKRAGIDIVIIGAEAGSDYELKLYDKRATLNDNYRTAEMLQGLDLFYVLVGFIMFGPNSTLETLRSNIEFLYKSALTDNLMQVANVLMLVRDSKLYHMLKAEDRVIEPANYWELPKYKFLDSTAERAANHWHNIFIRFPATLEVNKLQVNTSNVIARMTNPMNSEILSVMREEYSSLKSGYEQLRSRFGKLHYEYFIHILEALEKGQSDLQLESAAKEFFGVTYKRYLPIYKDIYEGFLSRVVENGFPLSGLVFRHFHSAMAIDGTKRI